MFLCVRPLDVRRKGYPFGKAHRPQTGTQASVKDLGISNALCRSCRATRHSVVSARVQAGSRGHRSQARLQPLCTEPERTTWFKIKNRNYSQMEGREELFERE